MDRRNPTAIRPKPVKSGQFARPLPVHVGLSDGANTEINGDGITEGTAIITGDAQLARYPGPVRKV